LISQADGSKGAGRSGEERGGARRSEEERGGARRERGGSEEGEKESDKQELTGELYLVPL